MKLSAKLHQANTRRMAPSVGEVEQAIRLERALAAIRTLGYATPYHGLTAAMLAIIDTAEKALRNA